MKSLLRLAAIFLAASALSTAAFAQTPTLVCRPLASPGDPVAGDEAVVGNQACKIIERIAPPMKAAPARRKSSTAAAAVAQPAPAAAVGPTPTLKCRSVVDTNYFLYEGEQLVGTQACKIIAIAAPSTTAAAPAAKPAAPVPASLADKPGMYWAVGGAYNKILGQAVDFGKSSASIKTLHFKSGKETVQLLGDHSQTLTGPAPEFYYVPAREGADAVKVGDVLLVHFDVKNEHRQAEIAAPGAGHTGTAVAMSHQVELFRTEVTPGVYKLAPAVTLSGGQYGFYLPRGESAPPYVYDFSVF